MRPTVRTPAALPLPAPEHEEEPADKQRHADRELQIVGDAQCKLRTVPGAKGRDIGAQIGGSRHASDLKMASRLQKGERVRDLVLPPGVTPVLKGKENPVVVSVTIKGEEVEEAAEAAAVPAADVPATAQKAPPAGAAPAADAKGGKDDKKKDDKKK